MTTQVLAPSTRISSGVPRRSKFQNYLGRVHVSVVASCTVGTRPFPNRERHFLLIAPAVATGFTGRCKAIHNNDLAPGPRGFVFNLSAKFAHADIGNSPCQMMILHHSLDVQVFQGDDIRPLHQGCGGLVQEVLAHGGNTGMNPRNLKALPVSAVAASLLAGQKALLALQVFQLTLEVTRIAGFPAVATDRYVFDAQIHAYRLTGQRQRLDFDLTGEANEIAAIRRLADRGHLGCSGGNLRPTHFEQTKFGQLERCACLVGALNLALIQLIADRLAVVTAFELRVFSALLEEVLKRLILIDQRLGHCAGGRISQPREFTALPRSHPSTERDVGMPLLPLRPRFTPKVKAAIPDKPRMPKFHSQLPPLGSPRVEPVFIGALNQHIESITQIGISCRAEAQTNAEKPAQIAYQQPPVGALWAESPRPPIEAGDSKALCLTSSWRGRPPSMESFNGV